MSKHLFSISSDFGGKPPSLKGLHKNLLKSNLPDTLNGISLNEDEVAIEYSTDLTLNEEVVLAEEIVKPIVVEKRDTILETIMLVPVRKEVKNKLDWQSFGGVVVSPGGFGAPVEDIHGQITGEYIIKKNENESNSPAEISLIETGSWNNLPDSELIKPPHIMPSTSDNWVPFTIVTNVQVRPGFWSYVFRARRGKAQDFHLRSLTLSIIRKS